MQTIIQFGIFNWQGKIKNKILCQVPNCKQTDRFAFAAGATQTQNGGCLLVSGY